MLQACLFVVLDNAKYVLSVVPIMKVVKELTPLVICTSLLPIVALKERSVQCLSAIDLCSIFFVCICVTTSYYSMKVIISADQKFWNCATLSANYY